MSVDQKMSVSIGDSYFQIVLDDLRLAQEFLPELQQWKTESLAGPGFRVKRPSRRGGLWVALGSDGAPIARSRDVKVVTSVLRRHLDALIGGAQQSDDGRFGLRAILGPGGAVLVDPSLLISHSVIERRFEAASLRVIDSPFVDLAVHLDRVEIKSVPRSGFSIDSDVPGHTSDPPDGTVVKGLLWLGSTTGAQPTVAQQAHALAGATRVGGLDERIELGLELAERLPVVLLDPSLTSSLVTPVAELLALG